MSKKTYKFKILYKHNKNNLFHINYNLNLETTIKMYLFPILNEKKLYVIQFANQFN